MKWNDFAIAALVLSSLILGPTFSATKNVCDSDSNLSCYGSLVATSMLCLVGLIKLSEIAKLLNLANTGFFRAALAVGPLLLFGVLKGF